MTKEEAKKKEAYALKRLKESPLKVSHKKEEKKDGPIIPLTDPKCS